MWDQLRSINFYNQKPKKVDHLNKQLTQLEFHVGIALEDYFPSSKGT